MISFITALLYLHVKHLFRKKVNLKEYTLVLIFEVFIPGEEINCLKRQYCVRLVRIFVVIIDSIELYCIQHYYLCNLGVD